MMHDLRPYPAYKESRLPWLSQLPAHWEEKRAKYFFREVDERSRTGEEELLSVSHVTGVTPRSQKTVTMFKAESYVGHKLCRPGDLVINTMWAWMAALGVAKQTGIVSPSYAVYRPTTPATLLPAFIDRLLRTQPYASEYFCRSTGIRASRLRLYPERFLDIPMLCPPMEEQQRMLAYLNVQDQQIRQFIRNKRRLIEVLNEQKQGIINRAVSQGLDPGVALKPSGIHWLGSVPEHWRKTRLKRVGTVQTGITLGKERTGPQLETRPYLRVANVQNGYLDLRKITEIRLPHSEAIGAELRSGDVLMTEGGDRDKLGRGYIWNREIAGCLHQNHIFAVRAKQALLLPEYLVLLMMSHYGRQYFLLTAKQTTNLASTNSTTLKAFPLFLPDIDEQRQLLDYVVGETVGLDAAITKCQKEIELIREWRARLIGDVVTGKADVRRLAPEVFGPVPDALEALDDGQEFFEDELQDADDLEPVEEAVDGD